MTNVIKFGMLEGIHTLQVMNRSYELVDIRSPNLTCKCI